MKKIYTVACLLMSGLLCSLSAQSIVNVSEGISVSKPKSGAVPSPMVIDTLFPASWGMPYQCDTTFVYYILSSPASGYAFGNNSIAETECAQKYYASGTVSEVLVWYARVTGTTGTTSAKVYSISATTKGPQTVLGTSAAITTGNITTTSYTAYTFSPAVAVTNAFAVASVFPTTASAGDSVAVTSTTMGCSTPDTLSWIKIGTWISVEKTFTGPSNLDLVILPVIDVTAGMNNYPSGNGLALMGAYPNPASDYTNIQYSINEQATVSIEIFDLSGRVVQQFSGKLDAGIHKIKVSLKNISAGNYYYTIKTGEAQLTSKFAVVK